jgi:hypothetical protein
MPYLRISLILKLRGLVRQQLYTGENAVSEIQPMVNEPFLPFRWIVAFCLSLFFKMAISPTTSSWFERTKATVCRVISEILEIKNILFRWISFYAVLFLCFMYVFNSVDKGVNDKNGGRVAYTMLPSELARSNSLNVECNYSSNVFGLISINVRNSVFQCAAENR